MITTNRQAIPPMVGTFVTVTVTFTVKSSGAVMDTTDRSFVVRAPDGTETTYTNSPDITHPSTGVYKLRFEVDQPGQWCVGALSTEFLRVTEETCFVVRPSRVVGGGPVADDALLTEDGSTLITEDGSFLIWQAQD